jgi:adenylate cyclase class IV
VPQNIELKVACSPHDLARVESLLPGRGRGSLEPLRQTDTYFRVANGRLKLRRVESGSCSNAELIQYQRPDVPGGRISDYIRVPIPVEHSDNLERALVAALGELVTVRKQRRVAVWQSTRIHLDEVERLGSFIELETVLGDRLEADARAGYEEAVMWLGLAGLAAIPGSYCDLLLERLEL